MFISISLKCSQNLRRTRFYKAGRKAFAVLVSWSLIVQPALAASTASMTLDGKTNTQLDKAQNGVDVVNIAKPNGDGVSRNSYNQFNIDERSVIFNNSNAAHWGQTLI
jgi:filamentous hemagglutinin